MCLALPARVTEVHDDGTATVDLDGVRQRVSLALLDDVKVDEFVVVHVGYALTRLDQAEAQKTLALFAELGGRP